MSMEHTAPTNADYTREYFDIMESLGGDVEGRRTAYDYMKQSTAIVHHQVVDSSFVPRLFNQQTFDAMKHVAETTHRILVKVVEHYLEDPEYRRVFSYDPRLEELILLPRGYTSVLPLIRVDTFLDEDTYRAQFCEVNGDGSSGMNENREITLSVARSQTFRDFAKRHRIEACELFVSWVDTFLDIYATYEHRVERPRIAIVDYLENGVVDEFNVFARLFRQRGLSCAAYDVRDLAFDGTALLDPEGKRIHAVWRRCVTNDVLAHWDESQPFLDAVRAGTVALIGSFAGHIVHDKQIFRALLDERTTEFLTADEITFLEETVPTTAFLDDDYINVAQIRANKEEWLIKPTDGYGATDVYAGCYLDQQQWEEVVDRYANGRAGHPFLVQRYIRPFRTETLPPDAGIDDLPDSEVRTEPACYNNLNGLYVYDGTFTGVFSRLGPLPTISKDMQGMTAATIWVDCDTYGDGPDAGEGGECEGCAYAAGAGVGGAGIAGAGAGAAGAGTVTGTGAAGGADA